MYKKKYKVELGTKVVHPDNGVKAVVTDIYPNDLPTYTATDHNGICLVFCDSHILGEQDGYLIVDMIPERYI